MNSLHLDNPATVDKELAGVEQTDLLTLVAHRERIEADCTMELACQRFRAHREDFCAVMEAGGAIGLLSRAHLGDLMGHRFGFSVYAKDAVRSHLIANPTILRRGTPVREALAAALGREGRAFRDDVILLGAEDEYLGIIAVPSLVRLQSALVEERFRVQEAMHRRLLEVSRRAGMAEVASGVLHNVGNVLNSVNVSTHLLLERTQASKLASLEKAVALLGQHQAQLGEFLLSDPKGRLLPDFLLQVTARLRAEQARQLEELNSLVKHVSHIKNIISTQQQYAKVSGMLEEVAAEEIVEDALRLNTEALERHGVRLERCFQPAAPILVDRHKVLQILINLIRNAKYAADHGPGPLKQIRVSIEALPSERVRIEVADNGVGIAPENLNRIFVHGFTTKRDGHGFGLHSSALAAKEMGGTLRVHSDGLGQGAVFTLELPAKAAGRT